MTLRTLLFLKATAGGQGGKPEHWPTDQLDTGAMSSTGVWTHYTTGNQATQIDYVSSAITSVTVGEGYRILVYTYALDETFEERSSYITTSYSSFDHENHKYKVVIRKTGTDNITVEEASAGTTLGYD